jgi:hypothetical protein
MRNLSARFILVCAVTEISEGKVDWASAVLNALIISGITFFRDSVL